MTGDSQKESIARRCKKPGKIVTPIAVEEKKQERLKKKGRTSQDVEDSPTRTVSIYSTHTSHFSPLE